jgi:16S rRNA (guanine1516-N2)-methyltransferase
MANAKQSTILGVYCQTEHPVCDKDWLCTQLNLPLLTEAPASLAAGAFVVLVDEGGLSLAFTGRGTPLPLRVDFTQGASAHRRKFGGGKGQLIAKAVGLKGHFRPHIHDLTAGLGQDAFVLATLGCQMSLVERVPVIFHLLEDGLQRAKQSEDPELLDIIKRLKLKKASGVAYLNQLAEPADVIYLDPMFPERSNSAKVKKAMEAFHAIVGSDTDAGELLTMALQKAKYRVVVKRPRKAPSINGQFPELTIAEPNLVISGKSSRFDVYTLEKMPTKK